jgi:cytochrome o ubiquinol oxidase subunit 1
VVAAIGAVVIFVGIVFQIAQLIVSIKDRKRLKDVTGDPWNGRTLEWSIPSPAPFYNFAITPVVDCRDPFWEAKQRQLLTHAEPPKPHYTDIHMPRNTATGFLIAMAGAVFCFALIWHMWIPLIVGALGIFTFVIARSFDTNTDYYVPAAEVEKTETELGAHNILPLGLIHTSPSHGHDADVTGLGEVNA